MILIAYDGSEDAKATIQHASELMPGAAVTVLAIWEPFSTMLARTPATLRPLAAAHDAEDVDHEQTDIAEKSSQEGVEIARAAGLDATSSTAPLAGSIAETIVKEADRLDVDAIVLDSRGFTGMALLIGSVSLAVLQNANRAVVIVPSAQ